MRINVLNLFCRIISNCDINITLNKGTRPTAAQKFIFKNFRGFCNSYVLYKLQSQLFLTVNF